MERKKLIAIYRYTEDGPYLTRLPKNYYATKTYTDMTSKHAEIEIARKSARKQ